MKLLRSLFAGLVGTTAAKAAEPAPTKSPAEMMREMRRAWLTRIPEKGTYKSEDEVVAVVMDWPLGEQVVTVLSSSVGDASLYTTGTFGVIGGIGHEKVRNAALAFVRCAQQHFGTTRSTTDFSYPDSKTLRFYMVTAGGVRVVSFPLSESEKTGSAVRALYEAGQAVITELRLITPTQK